MLFSLNNTFCYQQDGGALPKIVAAYGQAKTLKVSWSDQTMGGLHDHDKRNNWRS